MDIPQLKRLAGHVRSLLRQAKHTVSHNQSLDLIAALPGLRNWPEVQAFPDRVTACNLDPTSASRLSYRLKRKFELEMTPEYVLAALSPEHHDKAKESLVPQIWPTGPIPGVYVTTSQAAIDALVANYEEATDGALLYAERAANGAEGAIDLGDYGLWSAGLDRVPSGTLIVVGPLELVQDEWERSAERLQVACTHAGLSGHRVAVLVRTAIPADLCEDIRVLVKTGDTEGLDYDTELRGLVTETGELIEHTPFSRPWPAVASVRSIATPEAIPAPARQLLTEALERRKAGLLIFGSTSIKEHWAADLVDAALALTAHAGPAARIMPRFRSTPSKDWQVPEATKQLPYLPSIESAYARGYRRMIINPQYIEGKILKKLAGEVLFIAGTHGYEAGSMTYSGLRGIASIAEEMELLTQIIGFVGVVRLRTKGGVRPIVDLFLGSGETLPESYQRKELAEYVDEHRTLKWEDEVRRLINSGEVTAAELRSMDIRPAIFDRFKELTQPQPLPMPPPRTSNSLWP